MPDSSITSPKLRSVDVILSNLPQPSLTGINNSSSDSWDTPILLEDVDFDGDLELIIINHGRGQYWVNEFEVFDVDVVSNALVVTLKNDSPFSELDGWSEFNSEKKTITIYRRGGGACRAESETYLVAGSISTPIQMVEYVNTDAECYKLTYTYQNTDTGFSKALLKKEKFQWFE